ncbi:MAG: alpha/beta hydrolase, partial [Thermoleophilaceae bacterium]
PLPALPALVLSGEDDLRTPTETAREVAGRIPGAQFLPVPDHGHSLIGSSGCAARALVRFMAGGEAAPCHDPPQHSPKPLTALQLRCFVYVSELVGKRPRRHPSARLARCARVLAPVVPNGLPKPSAAAGTGRTY